MLCLGVDLRQGVGQTASFLGDAGAASAAAARIFALVDRRPPIDSGDDGGQRLSVVKGAVELRSVMPCRAMPFQTADGAGCGAGAALPCLRCCLLPLCSA